MTDRKPIYYGKGETEVCLGDYVRVRHFFFWKYIGRVVYIPGISPKHPEMEHHGLTWVGVRLDEGGFASIVVDPDTNRLCHSPLFIRRSDKDVEELIPNEEIYENHDDIEEERDDCQDDINALEEEKS